MPGEPTTEGLGAILQGARQYMSEGPLGAIEVPMPGENPSAGELINDWVLPEEPGEAAIMAAVPGAKALPPNFRRAVVNIGRQALRAGLKGMSQQEALIWSHKVFRAGVRQRTPSGTVVHHAKTGETHQEMLKRLRGRLPGKMEPVFIYNGRVLTQRQGQEVGNAMQQVIKRVRSE